VRRAADPRRDAGRSHGPPPAGGERRTAAVRVLEAAVARAELAG
jgi:hypothetical protein